MRALQILIVVVFLIPSNVWSQEDYVQHDSSSLALSEKECNRFSKQSIKRIEKLTQRVKKTNDKYLSSFKAAETALLQQMCAVNELRAEQLMQDAWYSFNRFENILDHEGAKDPHEYLAAADTLKQAVNYLTRFSQNSTNSSKSEICNCNRLQEVQIAQDKLKLELKRSELISKYFTERQAFLSKTVNSIPEARGILTGMKHTSYYFNSQLIEFKQIFSDRSRFENLIFSRLLAHSPFANFMASNGQLALPDPLYQNGTKISFDDLMAESPNETKLLLAALKSPETKKIMEIQEGISTATTELKELPNSIQDKKGYLNSQIPLDSLAYTKADSLSTVGQKNKAENPKRETWKPNPLKTKRFIDRINFGTNFQADKRNYLFPLSGTFSLHASYQLHRNCNIGIGSSIIVGFSRFLANSSEQLPIVKSFEVNGLNVRSFLDCRLKGSLFLQAGFEKNYRHSYSRIENPSSFDFQNMSLSTSSLLAGLKIKYPSSNKQSKPTLEILYDFLHSQTGQPGLVIRLGVEFNRKHGLK